ncbi:aldehyde dehydrogenase family protein, partial [Rhizobium ruizarguesonis]
VLAEIAACDATDVDAAVSKAKHAFDDGRWRLRSPRERKAVLLKLARLLEDNRHELAVMASLDSGKPVGECQTVDVPDTIHTLRWHAELIDKPYDNTAPVGANALTMIVRET